MVVPDRALRQSEEWGTVAETTMYPSRRSDDVDQLDALAARFEDEARSVRHVAGRLRQLRAGRARGRSWEEIVDGRRLGVLDLVDQAVRRLTESSATLRRLLVRGLRTEGATMPAIAQILGVSHQRVSVLLKGRNGAVPPPE
jgi:hypothetical protein